MTVEVAWDAGSRAAASPKVYARSFGEDLVLLDFAVGEYFGLDRIGALVWERLLAGDSLGDIADALVREYDVTRDAVLADVIGLASELEASSLVRRL